MCSFSQDCVIPDLVIVVQRVLRCPRNDMSCSVHCSDLHLSLPSTLTDDPLQLHVGHNVWRVMYVQARNEMM